MKMINSKQIKNYMTLQQPYTVTIVKIEDRNFWYTDTTKTAPRSFREFNTSHDNLKVGEQLKIIGEFINSHGYAGMVYERD